MPITQEPPITEEFKVCGNSTYGCSKYLGELYIKEVNPYIILRYSHLAGLEKRYYGLVGNFISRIERGLKPQLMGGDQSNDFLDVRDVARANYLALIASWNCQNQIYNIGSGIEITSEDAGKIVCKYMKWDGGVEVVSAREVDPRRFVFNIKKAELMLKFKAQYSFEDTVKYICDRLNKGGIIK